MSYDPVVNAESKIKTASEKLYMDCSKLKISATVER